MRPPPGFETRFETRNDVARITLRGELDMATAPILEEHLSRSGGNGTIAVVLDLHGVTYVDSSGLRAFLRARDRARHDGHRLIFVGANEQVRRVLALTGTEELLEGGDPEPLLERFQGSERATPDGADAPRSDG